ncbi:MAG: M56 family metallopeptidase [Bacteroidales bacterium]|nr:M56 family metallopeptidase [Bacteroidales bacterium]
MTPFLLYIARGGLYLGLFYAFYLLVMRRTTFFRLNRVLLLAGSYLCLLLPLIRLRSVSAASITSGLTIAGVGAESGELDLQATIPWKEVLLAIYLIGTLITLALFLISARKMCQTIRKGESTKCEGCRLVILEQDAPSFSWGRKVVMSRKDLHDNPAIFTHELMHVQCRHSRDLVLFMPLQILLWWNPLVWVTREELRLLHEYEADEGVIKQGIDASKYQLLLVRKAVGEHRFSLASGFQHAKLKNRITMMLKPASSGWIRWSYLALIPVLAAFMFACNPVRNSDDPTPDPEQELPDVQETRSAESSEQDAVPFQLIEKKPTFNGGDASDFSKWVNSQLHYPEQAKKDGAQGRVILQFTIGTDGEMRDIKVLRGVSEELDAEALRVISSSPKWEPGMRDGKAVPVTYTFPVVYQLR